MAVRHKWHWNCLSKIVVTAEVLLSAFVQVVALLYTQRQTTMSLQTTLLPIGLVGAAVLLIVAVSVMVVMRRATAFQGAISLIALLTLLALLG